MNFSSDNWAGASAPVAAALADAIHGFVPAYGADDATSIASNWFAKVFEREVGVFFVATGTAANALSLAAVSRPGGFTFVHETSHVVVDEAGAPEFFSGGSKLMPIPGPRGKITAEGLEAAIKRFHPPAVHHGRPTAVSLTQASEWGTLYSVDEISAIAKVAHGAGLKVHMDGARFANALVALNVSAADMTWRAGVDLLSFGGTKNGCWCAEAVVLFDTRMADDFAYARKRAGQLFSKSRFVAAQFQGYFDQGHWLDNAIAANAMARRLADGIKKSPHARLLFEPEANEVFAVWSDATSKRMRAAGAAFYDWPVDGLSPGERPIEGESLIRLVTSFATTPHDVSAFIAALDHV